MNTLKQLRKEKGILQKDVAQHLSITQQAYANYESGKRDPDNAMIAKLAEFFGVSSDRILGINNQNNEPGLFDDPHVRMIARGVNKMPPVDRDKLMQILKLTFETYFNEDGTKK